VCRTLKWRLVQATSECSWLLLPPASASSLTAFLNNEFQACVAIAAAESKVPSGTMSEPSCIMFLKWYAGTQGYCARLACAQFQYASFVSYKQQRIPFLKVPLSATLCKIQHRPPIHQISLICKPCCGSFDGRVGGWQ
jgi:hypothetical protein